MVLIYYKHNLNYDFKKTKYSYYVLIRIIIQTP